MNIPNDNIHTASGVTWDKKFRVRALGRGAVRKVSCILSHKLTVTGNPSMHSLHVWGGGKWGQGIVSVLELVTNIRIFAWTIGTSLHSWEKNRNWFGRQSSINCILLEFPLPSVVVLILLS